MRARWLALAVLLVLWPNLPRFDMAKARYLLFAGPFPLPPPTAEATYIARVRQATDSALYVALRLQLDSVRANADSLRVEACRGGTLDVYGTCTGRRQSPRVTVLRLIANRLRKHADRADSLGFLMNAPPPPIGCTPTTCPMYRAEFFTNSDSMWFPNPGVDTVTLCAVLTGPVPDTVRRVAWPPVRFNLKAADGTSLGDSVRWGTRGGNALAVMCAKAMQATGILAADSMTAPKVTWQGVWFPYRTGRLYRPLASVIP